MFKVNKHIFKTDKHIDVKLLLISDIHYSEKFDKKLEEKIILEIEKVKPNYICICGDIIDNYPYFNKQDNIDKLKNFIEKISITKTFIIFGNHDLEDVKHHFSDFSESIKKWKNIFKNSKNIYLLDNTNYCDAYVNFIGINLSSGYYHNKKHEDGSVLGTLLSKVKVSDKYNILLVHSPIRVMENVDHLKNIDLVLCGHMHDGAIFKWLKWLPGNRGIIGPHKILFPKHARGIIHKDDISMLVTGGITKLAPSHLKIHKLSSILYNSEIELINIRG